jgi:hypothetical protein
LKPWLSCEQFSFFSFFLCLRAKDPNREYIYVWYFNKELNSFYLSKLFWLTFIMEILLWQKFVLLGYFVFNRSITLDRSTNDINNCFILFNKSNERYSRHQHLIIFMDDRSSRSKF